MRALEKVIRELKEKHSFSENEAYQIARDLYELADIVLEKMQKDRNHINRKVLNNSKAKRR